MRFNVIVLLQLFVVLCWLAFVGFIGYAVVYAIGKYLFHWWT